jgi:U3 small nucleolar RNA-associated protein 7
MLVPGAGISQFDSGEADVYESYGRRREREVRSVMEKIQPDLITMDTDAFLGRVGDGGVANRPVHGPNIREVPFYKKTRAERLEVLGTADTEGAGVLDEADSAEEAGSDDEAGGNSKLGQGAKRREKIRQEKEKHKMRGKAKSSKRFLRKKRKNVVDPTTVSHHVVLRDMQTDPLLITGCCQGKAGEGTLREG